MSKSSKMVVGHGRSNRRIKLLVETRLEKVSVVFFCFRFLECPCHLS